MTILIAPVICFIVAIVINRFLLRRHDGRKRMALGFDAFEHVKKVMSYSQKHRGISNAVLQGSSVLKQPLMLIQKDIDSLIDEGNNFELSEFSQWQSFCEHWQRLKQHTNERDLPIQNMIRQHKIMIEGHLSLFDDIIMHYDLKKILIDNRVPVTTLCLDTLRLAETIAQARGIGAGVCAKGECKGVDRISLNFLRISLKADVEPLLNQIKTLDNKTISTQLIEKSNNMAVSVDALNEVLDRSVLVDGKTSINANDYFQIATKPIDELFTIFDILLAYSHEKCH